MDNKTANSYEAILDKLNNFSKRNFYTYFLLLTVVFFYGLHQNIFVFIAPDIKYRCNISECENTLDEKIWLKYAIPTENEDLSRCMRYSTREYNTSLHNYLCNPQFFDNETKIFCDSFIYSDEDSIVKDFNLACQDWKRTLLGTVHFAGNIIGLPLIGISSDKYGRKLTLIASVVILGATCVIKSFLVHFELLLALEFLGSGLALGSYNTALVFAMESVKPTRRVLASTVMDFACNLGHVAFTGLAWWLPSWRSFLKVVGIPTMLFASYFWLIDESARWLLSKGRKKEALEIVKKAAKFEKIDLASDFLSLLHDVDAPTQSVKNKEENILIDAIKSKTIRKRLLACCFLYITCNFVYYGLTINSVSLAGDKYLNFVFVSLAEMPASFVCLLVLDKLGRKITLMASYILSGLFCISLIFFTKDLRSWSIYFYLLGTLWISLAYVTLCTYMVELFPTRVRQTMISTCGLFGRLASVLSATTPILALGNEYLLAILFGILPLISAVLVFTLPETSNVVLPDTIE